MSISAEEKNRYLREAAIVLAREGFQTDRTHMGHRADDHEEQTQYQQSM